jgi:uncharacterized protein (TIGR03086 family)
MTSVVKFTRETASMTDPRDYYARALAQTELIVATVRPGQLDDPTPCTEFSVRSLLSHIVGGINRTAIVGEGGDALAAPTRADDVSDDGWPAAYAAASKRATTAWAGDETLDAQVVVPWGTVPGRAALSGYVQEVLTHGWDLAAATGQETEGDPELAAWTLEISRRILPPERRGGPVPFGPVVAVAADAGPYAQLAAWLGRAPR